jgi:YgiT-type zinc finger domain-containing protein
VTEEILSGMAEWRQQHPTATLREIEAALDARWTVARAQILQGAALASAAADLRRTSPEARSPCPTCGERLEARGQEDRTLTTHGDQPLTLRRTRAVCPACGTGLFPPG